MSTATVSRTVSTDKRYFGVYSATVTKVEDDKAKEGRVKIICHWFDEQTEMDWCRVAQVYAGNGYGAFFTPEPGDEVLLAFDNGDMRAPIILGGLYNGKDKPPTFRSSTKDQKMIHTKGGNELLLDDTPNKKRVKLTTSGGHTADLSDVDKKILLQSSGGQTVTLDDGAKKITVQAGSTTITMDASSGSVTIAGGPITLQSNQIFLGASGSATHPVPFGEVLLSIFNAHTHVCTAPGTPSATPLPILPPTAVSKGVLTS